jgi:hypothetical protein
MHHNTARLVGKRIGTAVNATYQGNLWVLHSGHTCHRFASPVLYYTGGLYSDMVVVHLREAVSLTHWNVAVEDWTGLHDNALAHQVQHDQQQLTRNGAAVHCKLSILHSAISTSFMTCWRSSWRAVISRMQWRFKLLQRSIWSSHVQSLPQMFQITAWTLTRLNISSWPRTFYYHHMYMIDW